MVFPARRINEAMKIHRELTIMVDEGNTEPFFQAVDDVLRDGWKREVKAEARARDHISVDGEFAYYTCDKRGSREAAMVAIYRRNPKVLYVSNVVPVEKTELSIDEYNAV